MAGVRVDLAAPGRYRVDAIDDAPLRFTVFQGHGDVRYGANSVTVSVGQALVHDAVEHELRRRGMTRRSTNGRFARDARYQQVQARGYVSPYMTGYEELDTYGDWVPGRALRHRLGAARGAGRLGTVPLRPLALGPALGLDLGRRRALGLRAVPLRALGRSIGGRWGWWPGSFVARPVWAPALVGFVGGGGRRCRSVSAARWSAGIRWRRGIRTVPTIARTTPTSR